MLAFSRNWFAFAMAVAASVALVARARQAGFAEELVPIGGAGLVGLFAVLAAAAERIWRTAGAGTVVLTVAGLALVAGGAIAAILGTGDEPAQDMPAGFPADAGRPGRRKFIDILGVLCAIATVSLALGVFGVFHDLLATGRGISGLARGGWRQRPASGCPDRAAALVTPRSPTLCCRRNC